MNQFAIRRDGPRRTEHQILLLCAKVQRSPEDESRLAELLSEAIDWPYVVGMAGEHGIRPILYKALNGPASGRMPEAVLQQFRNFYVFNVGRNLMLTQENLKLVRILQDAGIEAIPYKGPLQASMIYNNIGLREIGDLDIIVREECVLDARRTLIEAGYTPQAGADVADEQGIYRSGHYNLPMHRADGKVRLELHWKILAGHTTHGFDPAIIWDYSVREKIGEAWIRRLPPEMVFFLICIHNEKHNWLNIRFIRDAAAMAANCPDLDWDKIAGLAQEHRKTHALLVTCSLSQRVLGAPMPEAIQRRLRTNRTVQANCAMMLSRFFYGESFSLPGYGEWRENLKAFPIEEPAPAALPLYYLLCLLWPEYSDKRHFRSFHPQITILHVGARLIRFIKWNCPPWNKEHRRGDLH